MISLHRLKLRPRSPWRTPWQADTIAGALLATCARVHGPEALRERLIKPMLAATGSCGLKAGQSPPFVLSDACPGDLLPMPIWLRLAGWPQDVDRKRLKRARWLTPEVFNAARAGRVPAVTELIGDDDVFLHQARHHNTLSRLSDTTGDADAGLAPFQRGETMFLNAHSHAGYLSVYFRAADHASTDLFLDLFHELSLTGFGADVATGRGQFDIEADPEPMPLLDVLPETTAIGEDAHAAAASSSRTSFVCLSTFQPGAHDPTAGWWDAFPKFGKLGPELATLTGDHQKNALILFRPGACFDSDQPNRGWLGRAVPMDELLPHDAASILAKLQINVIHPAFGLAIPAYIGQLQ